MLLPFQNIVAWPNLFEHLPMRCGKCASVHFHSVSSVIGHHMWLIEKRYRLSRSPAIPSIQPCSCLYGPIKSNYQKTLPHLAKKNTSKNFTTSGGKPSQPCCTLRTPARTKGVVDAAVLQQTAGLPRPTGQQHCRDIPLAPMEVGVPKTPHWRHHPTWGLTKGWGNIT